MAGRAVRVTRPHPSADGCDGSSGGEGSGHRRSARAPRLATLSEHAGPVRGVAFSRDGRWLATVGSDATAQLWDVREPFCPRLQTRFTDHRDAVTSVALAPDGRTIATASDDGRAAVRELADSLGLRRDTSRSAPNIRVPAAAFTPTGAC
ncbi:WD40 repeat domain-containing protein [Streptomyces sp. NPDC059894]|uniref:WD40 repeat domain-containing protein n=1 Tax=unclassified Streptomyces TaxID=2593676 RepID=UPI00364BA905